MDDYFAQIYKKFSTASGAQSSCYRHEHFLNEWTVFGNLSTARVHHASALLNGALWMTGGYNWDNDKEGCY